jgi:hypothetical protein
VHRHGGTSLSGAFLQRLSACVSLMITHVMHHITPLPAHSPTHSLTNRGLHSTALTPTHHASHTTAAMPQSARDPVSTCSPPCICACK